MRFSEKEVDFIARYEKRGNSYRLKVYDGYKADGSQNVKTKTWKPLAGMTEKQIQKELERQLVLFEEEVKCGNVSNANIKFEIMADKFLEQAKLERKLRQLTIERLEDCKERTYKAIGHLRLDRITTMHIQKFINSLAEDGANKHTGKGLSVKTQKLYKGFISDVYDFAARYYGIYLKNPCKEVHTVKVETIKREIYDLEEMQTLVNLLSEKAPLKYKVFFIIAMFTGFRKGEILGLEWSDIDFENQVISINRTSVYSKEKGIITGTPKTENGYRSLKVNDEVMNAIRELKAEQDENIAKLGDAWHETDRLFTAWNGLPMGPDTPRHWLQKFCKKEGLRYVNVHSFRHFNATALIEFNCNVNQVSASLGHSDPTTTLNIYTHVFSKVQAKASEALSDSISLNVGG